MVRAVATPRKVPRSNPRIISCSVIHACPANIGNWFHKVANTRSGPGRMKGAGSKIVTPSHQTASRTQSVTAACVPDATIFLMGKCRFNFFPSLRRHDPDQVPDLIGDQGFGLLNNPSQPQMRHPLEQYVFRIYVLALQALNA